MSRKTREVFFKLTATVLIFTLLFPMSVGCSGSNSTRTDDQPGAYGQLDTSRLTPRQKDLLECRERVDQGLPEGDIVRLASGRPCKNYQGRAAVLKRQENFKYGNGPLRARHHENLYEPEPLPLMRPAPPRKDPPKKDDGVTWGDVWPWLLTTAVAAGATAFIWCAAEDCWYPNRVDHYPR